MEPLDPIAQAQAFKAELERLRKTSPHPYRLLSASPPPRPRPSPAAYRAAPQTERARAARDLSTHGKDPDLGRLEQEVSDLTGCPTVIGAGRITFRFTSLDELDGLLRRLRSGSPSKAPPSLTEPASSLAPSGEDLW